jgi:DDE superfamily endonuclease
MPASFKYVCQEKAWADQRFFRHCILEIWAPFALKKNNPTDLLMDEYSVHLMLSCCNQIKACGVEINFVTAGYTSKLEVMDLGVNKPFKAMPARNLRSFWLEMMTIGRFVGRILTIELKVVGKC